VQPDPIDISQSTSPLPLFTPEAPAAPQAIAPAWHTIVLIAAILAISASGSSRLSAAHGPVHLYRTYGATALMELVLLGWVIFGLRLKKITLRSLLGENSFSPRAFFLDIGIALLFWFASLIVLGTLALTWAVAQAAVEHRQLLAPNPQQQNAVRAMSQLAPSTATEIAAWVLLCLIVGVCEEIVFRGYLQTQFTRWARGAAAAGVVFSALVFGGAHAYQGARNMVLLAVFGALFSGLVLFRRSLRAAIFAHSWHDLVTGLALALLKSRGLI
jgi:uncharacterized protein